MFYHLGQLGNDGFHYLHILPSQMARQRWFSSQGMPTNSILHRTISRVTTESLYITSTSHDLYLVYVTFNPIQYSTIRSHHIHINQYLSSIPLPLAFHIKYHISHVNQQFISYSFYYAQSNSQSRHSIPSRNSIRKK